MTKSNAANVLSRITKLRAEITIFVVVFVSRIVLMPRAPAEWDSAQLALGFTEFDIRTHSPHPPGYWLYVECGRFVHWLSGLDPSRSLTVVSAVAMAFAAVVAWRVALRYGSYKVALAFTSLVMSNPFVWFYGLTANVYAFDLLCALLLMGFALKEKPTARDVVLIAITIGLMTGLRQSVVYIFGPLALYVVIRAKPTVKTLVAAAGAGVISVLIWLIPAGLDQHGGWRVLYESTSSMWKGAAKNTSILAGAPADGVRENIGKATATPIVGFLLVVLVAVVLLIAGLLVRRYQKTGQLSIPWSRTFTIAVLLTVPSLLVTTFGHFGKPGYILSYLPAVVLLACLTIQLLPKRIEIVGLVGLLLVAGMWSNQFLRGDGMLPPRFVNSGPWFFEEAYGVPFKTFTYDTISTYERDMKQYVALEEVVEPNDTIVYFGAEGIERFRRMSYVLPELTHELVDPASDTCTFAHNYKRVDCRKGEGPAFKVKPGGRALFVANAPNADIARLVDAGIATRLPLTTGPTVFAVSPGQSVLGIQIIEEPNLAEDLKAPYV